MHACKRAPGLAPSANRQAFDCHASPTPDDAPSEPFGYHREMYGVSRLLQCNSGLGRLTGRPEVVPDLEFVGDAAFHHLAPNRLGDGLE
jgi:hypothetical protein